MDPDCADLNSLAIGYSEREYLTSGDKVVARLMNVEVDMLIVVDYPLEPKEDVSCVPDIPA